MPALTRSRPAMFLLVDAECLLCYDSRHGKSAEALLRVRASQQGRGAESLQVTE